MTAPNGSPVDRVLSASLVVAPLFYLLTDILYVVRGWDDPAAGVCHVLASIAYALAVLGVVARGGGRLAAALLVVGMIGVAGNVAYGFDTIHVSLGDTALVDAPGAANLIKPLGLFFPLSLLLCAVALRRLAAPWAAIVVGVAALAFPIAHIGNIGWLAVAVDVALACGFFATVYRPAPAALPAAG